MTRDAKSILYFSSFGSLRWGGQKSLLLLVTGLDKHKYRPYVFLPTDEDFAEELRRQNIDVIIHKLQEVSFFNPFPCLASVRFLLKLIDDHEIVLMHTDGPRNTFYAGVAAKLKHRPLVWHIRSSEKDRYDALLVPLCTKIVLVANALRSRFTRTRNDEKFTTIYNGVDLKEFDGAISSRSSKRAGYRLDEATVLIGSFARIDAMKGQNHLIEACAGLRNIFPFKLFLYGEIYDQDYYHACLKTIEKLGLQEYVIFGNHQRDVVSILKEMDMVVLNSLAEAFPRSTIEAMAAAKPVIVANVGGAAEAVEEGVSGFVVTPGDTVMLADRMIHLGRDKELRREFGKAARSRVETLFTVEENVTKTEQVYEGLLDRKNKEA
ncbi:MAG: glycosyltransferase family 4 protein [Deltaproteobacteria bacterium]|nr:glycosyltransferase family 4 protein [Deltaproteobacteria bacterium]